MAKTALMIASLLAAAPLLAQGQQSSSIAQATVRLIKADDYALSGGYNPGLEVKLEGVVEQAGGGLLRLRMAFGSVLVDLGRAGRDLAVAAGQPLQVVASKVMQDGNQKLLAREVRTASSVIRLRDAQGLPIEEAAKG